jgi:hypothetical protein
MANEPGGQKKWLTSPWGDSNPQPPDPKSDALSIAPQGRTESQIDSAQTYRQQWDLNPRGQSPST